MGAGRLREEETCFRALVEKSHYLVAVLGDDGRFTYANPFSDRTMGFRPEETVGLGAFGCVHPDDVAADFSGGRECT